MYFVLFREEADVYMLVHYLYSKLPDNLIIVAKETDTEQVKATCVKALQKEANFLSYGLKQLLSDHEKNQALSDSDDTESDDLRKVGEKFKRQRERFKQAQDKCIDLSSARATEYLKKLNIIKAETDKTIVNSFSKFNHSS